MSDLAFLALAIVFTAGCYAGARMALPRHHGAPRIERPYTQRGLRR